eukprot:scaffold246721_cov22-Tisochrysis_lutea.AAC.1
MEGAPALLAPPQPQGGSGLGKQQSSLLVGVGPSQVSATPDRSHHCLIAAHNLGTAYAGLLKQKENKNTTQQDAQLDGARLAEEVLQQCLSFWHAPG